MLLEISVIFILFFANGIFAMYEIALVSSTRSRLEMYARKGNKAAEATLKQLEDPEKTLSTIQIGITLIGIISGAFAGMTLADDVKPLFEMIPALGPHAGKISVGVVVALVTYFSLIIGELVPKSIALHNPEKIAMAFTPFMLVLSAIARPFVWFLSISTKAVNKLFNIQPNPRQDITQDDLQFMISQSSEQGLLDAQEGKMIKDVMRFADKHANELMTHRLEVVCLKISDSKEQILEKIKKFRFSKYVLCDGDTSNVVGIVLVKDILTMAESADGFNLQEIIQPALFIPENIQASKVLDLFRQNGTKLGVVIDEYGQMEGIITLHDITEAIIGEINDSDQEPDDAIVRRQDGSLLVDGGMNVDDFFDRQGICPIDLPRKGFNTMGGMAMHFLKKVPHTGDIFETTGYRFEIVDMDKNRVDKLLVTKI